MKKIILSTLIIGSLTTTMVLPSTIANAAESGTTLNSVAESQFIKFSPSSSSINDIGNRTPLKQISNTVYEASIVGKTDTGQEEGVGTVLIKNTITNSYSEFRFQSNNPNYQYSPLKITCGTDDTVYIIVGGAFGTLNYGGSLYSLNLKTGQTKLVAEKSYGEQIVDAKIKNDKLNLEIYKFDDNFMNYTIYNKSINL
ncbi:MAG: DUF4652 domain-containing protein [Clostridium chrysemydis]|uniref:DUF4652 domain-containing protein n=1 Tax=Clostridium TaxID=1485 RepID=UPI002153A1E4|nr:DUF4652 domain-containing protein [Clostridium sp. LY3-2]MCR6514919.1 DUF4652 domain-containing protein [Clostridium sp. LY3-2]